MTPWKLSASPTARPFTRQTRSPTLTPKRASAAPSGVTLFTTTPPSSVPSSTTPRGASLTKWQKRVVSSDARTDFGESRSSVTCVAERSKGDFAGPTTVTPGSPIAKKGDAGRASLSTKRAAGAGVAANRAWSASAAETLFGVGAGGAVAARFSGCGDGGRVMSGGGARGAMGTAPAGRPFWQSMHLHSATHLMPARKQSQYRFKHRLFLQVQPPSVTFRFLEAAALRCCFATALSFVFSQFTHSQVSLHASPLSKQTQ
mmetsp:Transcript_19770/g.58899  ORF Transcript_19770/g.58899 Transcript_19770/m.58899 type:complete len:259 (-) Transcript_19770:489-1265(-)